MTRFERTGPTVPGWIRDSVRREEEAWPPVFLAAGAALAVLTNVLLGAILWTSGPAVYYALP